MYFKTLLVEYLIPKNVKSRQKLNELYFELCISQKELSKVVFIRTFFVCFVVHKILSIHADTAAINEIEGSTQRGHASIRVFRAF